MPRAAHLLVAEWPFAEMTTIGRATYCALGGTESHLGLYFEECTASEVMQLSQPGRHEPHRFAENPRDVTFDFHEDLFPRFQSILNERYWTPACRIRLYRLENVDAALLFQYSVRVCDLKPKNKEGYRLNALCGGCWCCACANDGVPQIQASTCVALTLRLIACAKAQSLLPLTDDAAAFAALGIGRATWLRPTLPRRLLGFTPRSALEALLGRSAIRLAPFVVGFARVRHAPVALVLKRS
ncbi:MAG: hypothetical protein CMA06_03320 [Euryarchaeota archaeon]|nr:hypothetical protein [Euryarchaeota archaeon]|tara:strand:- start:4432 stop:5154 length:723 start_codon:yes stop_codon:yes gene_type:complete